MRRVSQPNVPHHTIGPTDLQLEGASSSQNELRRLRVGRGSDSSTIQFSSSLGGTKITSFAQSVLALHKLHENTGGQQDKIFTKRKAAPERGYGVNAAHVSTIKFQQMLCLINMVFLNIFKHQGY